MALDIKRELSAVDNRNYDFYDKLTPEEQKSFSAYVLMRYTSNVKGDADLQEWYLERTNELVNKDHWTLSKDHKALLWKLYAGVGVGTKLYHEYLAVGKKEKPQKIEKLLEELHPMLKYDEIKILAKSMSKEDIAELFDTLGLDKKQRKAYE
jgi:hypothetical protein